MKTSDDRCEMEGRQLLVYSENWSDAVVIEDVLVSSGACSRFRRADDRQQLELCLDEGWDAVLLCVRLPDQQFSGWLAKLRQRRPALPIILICDPIGEEATADLFRLGIHDLVLRGRLSRLLTVLRRLAERRRGELITQMHGELLEILVANFPLPVFLGALAERVEALVPGAQVAVMLAARSGRVLEVAAAPTLSGLLAAAIGGLTIGERMPCCASAAARRTQVVAETVADDPQWADYWSLMEEHGRRACWSTPILNSGGELLGTVDLYLGAPGRPDDFDQRVLAVATRIAGIGIERYNEEQ